MTDDIHVRLARKELQNAQPEISALIELGDMEALSSAVEWLVPAATVVAKAEGHNDVHLVLERELDL